MALLNLHFKGSLRLYLKKQSTKAQELLHFMKSTKNFFQLTFAEERPRWRVMANQWEMQVNKKEQLKGKKMYHLEF